MKSKSDQSLELTQRLTPIIVVFVLVLLLIAGKVLYLQVGMGTELRKRSQVNRIQHQVLPAQRGAILDRNGKVLAADEPVFNLVRRPGMVDRSDTRLERLAREFNVESSLLKNRVEPRSSSVLLYGLSDRQRIWFAENSDHYPNLTIRIRPRRVYQFDSIISPVLGYTGEISSDELNQRRTEGLYQGKYVGKAGIEKEYDSLLQGHNGMQWVETTATGERIRVLDSPEPIQPRSGDSISLNIDIFLQKAVASSFPSDSYGASVVMEIPSGRVRALYSHPSYDPNKLISGLKSNVDKLLDTSGDPLHNRAIQSRFPPGSTFKTIPYAAALKNNNYERSRTYHCSGKYQLGDQTFSCWKDEGHGKLNLKQGLINSCNVYFYNLVRKLGYEPILKMGEKLKFNKKTNVDLPDESNPQLSSPQLKKELTGNEWVGGDAVNAVIGQGFTLLTPIKQAQLFGTMLTGKWIQPGIKKEAEQSSQVKEFPVSPVIRKRLRNSLDAVTDEGTGFWAQHRQNYQSLPVDIIGKTGTIQKTKKEDQSDTPPSDAWFVSAAPKESPRYVVVVFRSEAGSGGSVAAPQAREIYEEMIALGYFRERTIGVAEQ